MDVVLQQLATVAVLVERIVQFVKMLPGYSKVQAYAQYIDMALVVAANLGLCYFWNVNVFAAAGFGFTPLVGQLLTGVLASLGSEIVHEFVELLKLIRAGKQDQLFGL